MQLQVTLLALSTLALSSAQPQALTGQSPVSRQSLCLDFTPDPGIRIAGAAVPAAKVDPTTGEVWVYCSNGPQRYVSTSADGLNFAPPWTPTDHQNDPRCTLMPFPDQNGQPWWRRYRYHIPSGGFISDTSTDGIHYTPERGFRYIPPASDGAIGVYHLFTDSASNLHLFYIADMGGPTHGVRRARSTDGGDNFEFIADNVLGDMGTGSANQHVDPKFIRLPDGRLRLFTMHQGGHPATAGSVWAGEIYSFTSLDDGRTFHQDEGVRLACPDFTQFEVWSLNDPWVVHLPNGKYRMYIAGLTSDGAGGYSFSILSATAR